MAIDFDFRDPKNQKMIMTFLIPLVVIAAFFQFVVKPVKEEVTAKTTELTNVQNQLDLIKKSLKTPKDLEVEKALLTGKLEELRSMLPEEENVADLITKFSEVERESNVYLVGFEATQSVEGGEKPYKENKYRMTIEAGYHQFAEFMSKVMALPRIMSFSDIRITVNPLAKTVTATYEGMENQPRNLTIECVLTTFLYQDVAAEEKTPAKKAAAKPPAKK